VFFADRQEAAAKNSD